MGVVILHVELLATKSFPTSDKMWGAVVSIGLVFLVSGFWVPWYARRRAARIDAEGADGAEQRQLKRKKAHWAALSRRSALSVIVGQDGRLSSSKTVAYLWTILVVYVLCVLVLTWPANWGAALKHLYPTYLLLLGGPYASLILSKAIVTTRTNSGDLKKSSGDGTARLSDLVGDDSGRTDLFDVQFVLFNVLALWFVFKAFNMATTGGFPEIPSGLVLLTGGPAAVYLSNKLFTSTNTTISAVTPSRLSEGQEFVITGTGFLANYVPGVSPETTASVEVDGYAAVTNLQKWTDTTIRALAPHLPGSAGTPVRVSVTCPSGASATKDGALTVDARPRLEGAASLVAGLGGEITLTVNWPPGTPIGSDVHVTIGATVIPAGTTEGPGRHQTTFALPADLTLPEDRRVGVVVKGPTSESAPLELQVT